MEKKSDMVRKLVADGEYKKALRIAKDFRLGISREDSDILRRGYECMTNPEFYRQIRFNVKETVQLAIDKIKVLYGKNK